MNVVILFEFSFTIVFTILKLTSIISILKSYLTISVLFTMLILSFINFPIIPMKFSIPMHFPFFELPIIKCSMDSIIVEPYTIHLIVLEFSFITTSIAPFNFPFPMFQPLLELALINIKCRIFFISITIWLVINPIANISVIMSSVGSMTMLLIIFIIPFINFSIFKYHFPTPVCHIINPITLKIGTIIVLKNSISIPVAIFQLTFINSIMIFVCLLTFS